MSRGICPIGRHNISVESLESFANDLSLRFNANVEYGYQDNLNFDIHTGENFNTYEFISLGRIDRPSADITLRVFDEYFQQKKLIQQYGKNVLDFPGVGDYISEWDITGLFKNFKADIYTSDMEYWGNINNDIFYSFLTRYDSRYYWFCKTFSGEDNFDQDFQFMNKYRRQTKADYAKFGCNLVIYCNDGDESDHYLTEPFTWQEIIDDINAKYKDRVYTIPDLIHGKQILPIGIHPLAFFDDFSDLE
jgi:hypothetical protein